MKMEIRFTDALLEKVYLSDPVKQQKHTYLDIYQRAQSHAASLSKKMNGKKGAVLVACKENAAWISVLMGCWMSNITPAIFAPNLTEETYANALEEFGLDLFVSDFATVSERLTKNSLLLDNKNTERSNANAFSVEDTDIALLLFSSGTSGKQKCIPLSFANLTSNIHVFANRLGFSSETVFLCGSPLYHAHGLYNSFLTSFFLNASVIYGGQISALNVNVLFNAIQAESQVVFHIAPSMIPILLMHATRNSDKPLPIFAKVICGTSFLDSSSKAELEKTYGIKVLQQYGMTETLFMTINDIYSGEKPDSVGQPLADVEMEICDGSTILTTGEAGSIRVKSPACYGSYYRSGEEENSFRDDFFYTGDIGYFDENKCLFITGREKDLIKKGGFSISGNVISKALMTVNGITEAYTIGVKDAVLGEEIYSFYIAVAAIDENEIKKELKKQVAANVLPKRIFQTDVFQKTATGKIMRPEIEAELKRRLDNE